MYQMKLSYTLQYLYYYMLFLFTKLMNAFKNSYIFTKRVPPIKIKSEIEKYELSYLIKFMKTIDISTEQPNSNIDAILYNRKELLEQLKDPNNEYEKKWRKNILYETTPRGNIVMHYDIFKQGFAYYSDQTITYNLLNVAAMKYCVYFSCRDFFTDDHILTSPSPFTKILMDEEKAEADKKRELVKQQIPNMANARLVKFKNYSTVVTPDDKTKIVSDNSKRDETKDKNESLYTMNKFINLGKIINFSFTQKIPINKQKITINEPTVQTTVNSSLFSELFESDIKINLDKGNLDKGNLDKGNLDKGKMNYKSFKAAQILAQTVHSI